MCFRPEKMSFSAFYRWTANRGKPVARTSQSLAMAPWRLSSRVTKQAHKGSLSIEASGFVLPSLVQPPRPLVHLADPSFSPYTRLQGPAREAAPAGSSFRDVTLGLRSTATNVIPCHRPSRVPCCKRMKLGPNSVASQSQRRVHHDDVFVAAGLGGGGGGGACRARADYRQSRQAPLLCR